MLVDIVDILDRIREHGGKFTVSVTGRGMRVSVLLPKPSNQEQPAVSHEPEKLQAGNGSHSGLPIYLSADGVEREKSRILSLLAELKYGQQGVVDIIPRLHFSQVYQVIHWLRKQKFMVRPQGERVIRNGNDRAWKFSLTEAGSVRLFVKKGSWYQASNLFESSLPELSGSDDLDSLSMTELLRLPGQVAVMRKKLWTDEADEQSEGGHTWSREPVRGNAHRIDQLLREVGKDLKNRGVHQVSLDWSLVKKPRSHSGSRFFKKNPSQGNRPTRRELDLGWGEE